MLKILALITAIIIVNLLAFLGLGHILDALFDTDGIFLLVGALVSIPFLGIIMYSQMGKYLAELETYRRNTTDDR